MGIHFTEGNFTNDAGIQPTCHVSHLPEFIKRYDEFKSKGVDVVACLAYNDAWVMSGWGRVSGGKADVSINLHERATRTKLVC